jgi:hypothetical protein
MEESKKKYTEAQKRAIYKYKEKNKDKVADILSIWKLKNADHIKEYSAQYYQKNKERILKNRKDSYESLKLI